MKRSTQEDFIAKAKLKHGDRYTYERVQYKQSKAKVVITCPVHGDFLQIPNTHLNGSGCNKCGYLVSGAAIRSSAEEFSKKATQVHKGKYTYDNVVYVSSQTKVNVTCPDHGDFLQTPADHLTGYGCSKCAKRYIPTTVEFIANANKVHNNRYTYSNTVYKKKATKVAIDCPEHGEFWQTPNDHLSGHGCPNCAYTALGESRRHSLEEFIVAAKKVHGDKYSYEKSIYTRSTDPITVTCSVHGDFTTIAHYHVSGGGCSYCRETKGEKEVAGILDQVLANTSVTYVREYSTPECRNKHPLEFDFALMREEDVIGLIEYHGEQHYRPVTFGGSKSAALKNFEVGQRRDAIKESFARTKKIPMLIIPYTDFASIEELVDNFVSTILVDSSFGLVDEG